MANQFAPDGGPKSNVQIQQTVIPTVRVRRLEDDAECIINRSDFNEELHEEIVEKKKEKRASKKDEVEETETETKTETEKQSKRPKL